RPVAFDELERFLEGTDDPHRENLVEVLGRPVVFGSRGRARNDCPGCGAAAYFNPLGRERADEPGQETRRDLAVDEEGFDRVADGGALRLGVDADTNRVIQVCGPVDVELADSLEVLDHGNLRLFLERADELLAAARDDDVHGLFLAKESPGGGAICGPDE